MVAYLLQTVIYIYAAAVATSDVNSNMFLCWTCIVDWLEFIAMKHAVNCLGTGRVHTAVIMVLYLND